MERYFITLILTVVMTMFVIGWAPIAKGGHTIIVDGNCLDLCEQAAECQCAKILGGSLRETTCNVLAECVPTGYGWDECECDVDPLCKLWEKDVVVATFPPVNLWCGGDAM